MALNCKCLSSVTLHVMQCITLVSYLMEEADTENGVAHSCMTRLAAACGSTSIDFTGSDACTRGMKLLRGNTNLCFVLLS